MNWFEKHLNWTAIIITFCGFLLTCLIILTTLGFNLVYELDQLNTEYKIYLLFTISGTTLISILGMLWVIKKKKHNLFIVLFFVLALLITLANFTIVLFFRNILLIEFPLAVIFMTLIISSGIWIIGLLILLILRSKINNEYIHSYWYRNVISIIAILMIILATVSCFRINTRLNTYIFKMQSYWWDNKMWGDPKYSQFTFEYPRNYFQTWGGDVRINIGDEMTLVKDQISLFTISSVITNIDVTPTLNIDGQTQESTLVEQCINYYYKSYYGHHFSDNTKIENLTINPLIIDGIPAKYATFIVGNSDSETFWSEIKLVCFKREGTYWIIRLQKFDDKTINTDSNFDHLIKTFHITE